MNYCAAMFVAFGALLTACTVGDHSDAGDAGARVDGASDAALPECTAPVSCDGLVEVRCGPSGEERTDCSASAELCAAGIGCVACLPGRGRCEGAIAMSCRADGSGFDEVERCNAAGGFLCDPAGVCVDACGAAAESGSYLGCEYWPVVTLNESLQHRERFVFAVAVSNPHRVTVPVTVHRGGREMARVSVGAGAVEVITLPWIDGLVASVGSVLSRDSAYRLRSSLPVVVYQFNPLDYRSGDEFSFTNDASLLLPTHALAERYLAITRDPLFVRSVYADETAYITHPGFVSIVATQPGTTQVDVRATAAVAASSDGTIPGMVAGESRTFELRQGDVLQLASAAPDPAECEWSYVGGDGPNTIHSCAIPPGFDLTGTEISASGPVQLVSGHSCAFLPFDRFACDHLEESIFPEQAWDREAFVSIAARRGESNFVRIVSGTDGNEVHFEPPIRGPVTLDRGELVELETTVAIRVIGTGPLQVAQFLVGQEHSGLEIGDPAMWLAIPTAQQRREYTILAPASYSENWLSLDAPTGTTVLLDGAPVSAFVASEIAGRAVASIAIAPGTHRLESIAPFGVIVHGYGAYTSYAYPGGLDLIEINPLD